VIVPLGPLPASNSPNMSSITEYISNFYQTNVKLLSPIIITEIGDYEMTVKYEQQRDAKIACRRNPYSGQRQLFTMDIFKILRKMMLSEPGFCLIGLTMYDLYSSGNSNFVFGEADTASYVGIFSFSRYSPYYYNNVPDQFMNPDIQLSEDVMKKLLWRAVAVSVHEIGHMFGLDHCIYFQCVLNGSNSLPESDAQPQHLCPVCLHKLYFIIEFDPAYRYNQLKDWYHQHQFQEEWDWVDRSLQKLCDQ